MEEKEECVLSSNRKDNAAFAGSGQDKFSLTEAAFVLRAAAKRAASPSGLRLSLNRYLFGMVR